MSLNSIPKPNISPVLEMQVVYHYFTQDEWKLMAKLLMDASSQSQNPSPDVLKVLTKFPSFSLLQLNG